MTDDNEGVLSSAAKSKSETHTDESKAQASGGEKVMFNARIPERLRDRFQRLCEEEGVSMSWAVRRYMKKSIDRGETGHLS